MLTPELLHILQHSLGVNEYGKGAMYRNRFVTGTETSDFEKCMKLVEAGFMIDRGAIAMYGGMHYFEVTDAGKAAMRDASPEKPKNKRRRPRKPSH